MLKLIGYWTDTKYHGMEWIHPKDLVDPKWEFDRRSSIVTYLRSGIFLCAELGYSYCRFEGGPPDCEMGDSELTDGVWVWPKGLAIYVERYHIRLPDEFIRHMEKKNFSIPEDLDVHNLNNSRYDVTFWKTWCKREKRKLFIKSIRNLLFLGKRVGPNNV